MNRLFLYSILLIAILFTVAAGGFGQTVSTSEIVGGRNGTNFSDADLPQGARILEIRVFSGDLVDAIQIAYLLPDGRTMETSRHGGQGGQRHTFRLDSDEQFTGVSGRYGEFIDSIQIHTNKRTSPSYGGSGGNRSYNINIPTGNQAVGFAGRSGDYLDAVGLIFRPIWIEPSGGTDIAGGRGGSPFADYKIPQGAGISAVYIWSGDFVDGIQLVYTLRNGSIVEGDIHGGRGGTRRVFRLADNEYITGISGRYGELIDSVRILTNRRSSEVFGGRGGNRDYKLEIPSGNRAIGFKGRAGEYLDAIGLEYIPVRDTVRRSPFQRPSRDRNRR